jgi:hypothetical protein
MPDTALDALIATVAVPLLAALVLTGCLRFAFGARLGPLLAGGAIALAFSAGYLARLGVPDFPPDAAMQKLVFIAALGFVIGFFVDIFQGVERDRLPMILVWPVLVVAWIGWREVLNYTGQVGVTMAVSWAFGAFIMIRLTGQPEESKSAPAFMLLFATIGVGILAVIAHSPMIAQLAAALATGTIGFLLWNWPVVRYPLGAMGALGGGGVLLGLAVNLGLFAESVSRPALAVLILVFVAPPLAARLPLGRHPVLGPMVLAIVAAIPVLIAVVIAL